jgi:hypothetical protein
MTGLRASDRRCRHPIGRRTSAIRRSCRRSARRGRGVAELCGRRTERVALFAGLRAVAQLAFESLVDVRTVGTHAVHARRTLLTQPRPTERARSQLQRRAAFHERRRESAVYANASSVVPANGVVSSVDARNSASFGRVAENLSDLRSETRQLRLALRPDLGHVGSLSPGSEPLVRALEHARAAARLQRHDVWRSREHHMGSRRSRRAASVHLPDDFLAARHARRAGVLLLRPRAIRTAVHADGGERRHGDGLANDRAFIFNPASASDATLGNALQSLRTSGSKTVRDCINRQVGQPAARASCEGPWTAALNLNVVINGGDYRPSWERFQLGLNLTNPLGGLDQALHGSSNLKGWGTPRCPIQCSTMCAGSIRRRIASVTK